MRRGLFFFVFIFLFSVFQKAQASDFKKDCESVRVQIEAFLDQHITVSHFDETIATQLSADFLENALEYNQVLLKSDAEKIKSYFNGLSSTQLYREVAEKECAPFFKTSQVLNTSFKKLRSELGSKETFTKEVKKTLANPKRVRKEPQTPESPFVSIKSLKEFYLNLTAYNVEQYFSQGVSVEEALRYEVNNFFRQLDLVSDFLKDYGHDQLVKSFASSLDAHSSFDGFRENSKSSLTNGSNSFMGIGITFQPHPKGLLIIQNLRPESDPEYNFLKPGRVITLADKKPLVGMSTDEAIKLLKGPKDTKVLLSFWSYDQKTKTTFTEERAITRKPVHSAFTFKFIERENRTYLYLRINSFYSGLTQEIIETLSSEENNSTPFGAIIVDLRSNPGGILEESLLLSALFLKEGPYIELMTKSDQKDKFNEKIHGVKPGMLPSISTVPLVVVVNEHSASASEIFSAAIKDYKRGLIVGPGFTYGKGSMQVALEQNEKVGSYSVTSGLFFMDSGESTQGKGVVTDINIPSQFLKPHHEYQEKNAYKYYRLPMPIRGLEEFQETVKLNQDPMVATPEFLKFLQEESFKRTGALIDETGLFSWDQQLNEVLEITDTFSIFPRDQWYKENTESRMKSKLGK